eukprot:4305891-Prymnesium_polylepis.2
MTDNMYPNTARIMSSSFTGNADLPYDFFMSRYKEVRARASAMRGACGGPGAVAEAARDRVSARIQCARARAAAAPHTHAGSAAPVHQAYAAETIAFVDALVNDTPVPCTGEDGLVALVMSIAAGMSAEEKRWVKFSELSKVPCSRSETPTIA